MKKLLFSAALIAASFTMTAQVGVGTTTPKGALQVTSTTSGVIIPQFADLTAIQAIKKANGTTAIDAEEQGMQVYNIAEKKIYMWTGAAWVANSTGGSAKWLEAANGNIALDNGASTKDSVIYRANGGFSMLSKSKLPLDPSTFSYYHYKDFNSSDYIKAGATSSTGHFNGFLIDAAETRTNGYWGTITGVTVDENNTIPRITLLRSVQNNVRQDSDNSLGRAVAQTNNAYMFGSGDITEVVASHGDASIRKTGGTITRSIGGEFRNTFIPTAAVTATSVTGVNVINTITSNSTITNLYGIRTNNDVIPTSGAITNSYDLYADAPHNFAAITNQYGLYLLGANKHSVVQGRLHIGTTSFSTSDLLTVSGSVGKITADASGSRITYSRPGFNYISTSDATSSLRFSVGSTSTPSLTIFTGNQNVRIGSSYTVPDAKLEVDGYIKVGSTDVSANASPAAGMIRYNSGADTFQGYVNDTGSGSAGWIDLH